MTDAASACHPHLSADERQYERRRSSRGKTTEIIGLNRPSANMHGTLSGELAGNH